jgi:hypothetical protein
LSRAADETRRRARDAPTADAPPGAAGSGRAAAAEGIAPLRAAGVREGRGAGSSDRNRGELDKFPKRFSCLKGLYGFSEALYLYSSYVPQAAPIRNRNLLMV